MENLIQSMSNVMPAGATMVYVVFGEGAVGALCLWILARAFRD